MQTHAVKKRRVLIIAAVVFALAVVSVVVWPGEREPEYQGKTLSACLDAYCSTNATPVLRDKASAVVSAVGTNGVRRPDVRLVALKALRVEVENDRIALGDEGVKSAAAAVRTCLSDSDLIVRTHATNALRVIAPEVLETNRVGHTNNF